MSDQEIKDKSEHLPQDIQRDVQISASSEEDEEEVKQNIQLDYDTNNSNHDNIKNTDKIEELQQNEDPSQNQLGKQQKLMEKINAKLLGTDLRGKAQELAEKVNEQAQDAMDSANLNMQQQIKDVDNIKKKYQEEFKDKIPLEAKIAGVIVEQQVLKKLDDAQSQVKQVQSEIQQKTDQAKKTQKTFKDKMKEKYDQVFNKTKTPATSTINTTADTDKQQKQFEGQTNSQQLQSQQIVPQRKVSNSITTLDIKSITNLRKQSFNELKSWDDRCTAYMNDHKNISENIFLKLDRRIKLSTDSMSTIIKYFKEKKDIEGNYCKSLVSKLPRLQTVYKDVQDSITILYPKLSQAMQETDEMNDLRSKQIQVFINYIEKNVLKDQLIYDQNDFDKKIKVFRDNIDHARKQIKKDAADAQLISSQYTKLYHDMIICEEKSKLPQKDLYNLELKYKSVALKYMESEREFGKEVMKLWDELKILDMHRLEIIQQSFQLYIQKYMDTYGKIQQSEASLNSFASFQPTSEGEKNYDIISIIQSEDLQIIKKNLEKEDISLKDVKFYMEDFNKLNQIEKYTKLVIRKFQAQRDVGNVTKTYKLCELIVTIDDYLLFIDECAPNEFKKAEKKLNMMYLAFKPVKEKQNECYIVEKKPGILFETKNSQLLKFNTEIEFQEFKEFIEYYKAEEVIE